MAPSDREIGPQQRHSGLGHLHGQMQDLDALAGGIGPSYDANGQRLDPMAGFRSIIKETQAAAQTVRQVTQELKLAADAARQFQATSRQMMSDAASAMQSAAEAQRRLAEGLAGGGGPPGPPRGGRRGTGSPEPDDDGAARGSSDRVRAERRGQTKRARQNAQRASDQRATSLHGSKEGMDLHERNTRSGLRRMVAEGIHQAGGRGNRFRPTLRPRYDADGNLSHYDLLHPNGTAERIETTSRRLPRLLAQHATQGIVSGIARGLLSGGVMGAARGVPVLGTAIAIGEGVNKAATWATEQQKKNSFYQSIYGGDKASTGIANRFDEEGFVLGNRFDDWNGLNEQDARAAFQGVSQLGYRGAQRSDNLDFIEQSYGKLGLDVNTSLKLLQASASHANTSLTGLSTALNGVQQMAVATGQSANVLYSAFADNYNLALSMGGGSGSAALAAGITGSTIGADRQFANINTSNLNSTYMHYRLAQAAGTGYGNLLAQSIQGNPVPLAQAQDRLRQAGTQGVLNNNAKLKQVIEQGIAANGGAAKVAANPNLRQNIVASALEAAGGNIDAIKAAYQAQSQDDVSGLSDDQFVDRLIYNVASPSGTADATKANLQQWNRKGLASGDSPNNWAPWVGLGVRGTKFVQDNTQNGWGAIAPWATQSNTENSALDAYTNLQKKTNSSDPVIESLIQDIGKDSNTGIEVQTGNGKKVVSLSDAINYYSDQLGKGTATIVGGAENGKDVKTAVGGAETNITGPDSSTDTTDHGGVSADQWMKDHPDAQSTAQGGSSGTVTISMTPQMAQFFQINTTGAAKYDAAASNGVPPTPSGAVPQ